MINCLQFFKFDSNLFYLFSVLPPHERVNVPMWRVNARCSDVRAIVAMVAMTTM